MCIFFFPKTELQRSIKGFNNNDKNIQNGQVWHGMNSVVYKQTKQAKPRLKAKMRMLRLSSSVGQILFKVGFDQTARQ